MMARIYKPAKTAMQSGRGKTKRWLLEYEPQEAREREPLMGWVSAGDTRQQLRISFETKDEAIAYARAHGLAYQLFESHERRPQTQAYADNFAFDRRSPWTH